MMIRTMNKRSVATFKIPEAVNVQFLVDYALYIGRFHPLHPGHEGVVVDAFRKGRKVIVAEGSAGAAANIHDPFTAAFRRRMFIARFRKEYREGRLIFITLYDHPYENGAWHKEVLDKVNRVIANDNNPNGTVGLVGFLKDQSSDYLNWFPNWKSLVVSEQIGSMNATDIRETYFREGTINPILHRAVASQLKKFKRTAGYRRLRVEQLEVDHCHKKYGKGPFQTSDILIEYGDKILAIVRGGKFGNGLIALPGGINDGEDPIDCAVRELDEEVGMLKLNPWLTEELLRSWIIGTHLFNKPGRDARGDYHTTCVHIRIPTHFPRPIVKGDDDAKAAHFIPRKAFKRHLSFADHFHIIIKMMDLASQRDAVELKQAA
jgi:bifunctional NMN adenylyltransferase/nudix hydrolase